MGIGLIWPYLGGVLFTWGSWKDRKYRLAWIGGFLLWGWSIGFSWQIWPQRKASSGIRIATFNMDGGHYNRRQIERIADSLRTWHPDILCLQETYLGDYNLSDFVRRLGYTHHAFLRASSTMGMLIVSDFPITHHRTHLLLPGSTNGLHTVRVHLPQGEIYLIHIHFPSYRLGNPDRWRWRWFQEVWKGHQIFEAALSTCLSKSRLPSFVCGDFNATPYHPLYSRLSQGHYDSFWSAEWGTGPTWRYPWLRIDYIWGPEAAQGYTVRWIPKQAHAYVEGTFSLSPAVFQKALPLRAKGR
jgi:endonuclease/exonuclease/phosphatase family metal-dependent hydrolase